MSDTTGIPIYVLWGNEPDKPSGEPTPLNVFKTHQEAENVLASALALSYQQNLENVEAGGTCSILLQRKNPEVEGSETNGSFAIVNPGKPRSVWDFRVEKRTALLVTVREEA